MSPLVVLLLAWLFGPPVGLAVLAGGMLVWERLRARRERRWAAGHGIDLSHTARPRFLGGRR